MKIIIPIFCFFVCSTCLADIRWSYDKPPKFFRDLFEEPKIKKVLKSTEENVFVNKEDRVQLVPLAFYQLVKWLNRGLSRMNETVFDQKRVKFYAQRDSLNSKAIKGRFLRQGNRIFCFPCLLKKNNKIAYGEFVRKDVFLVKEGELAVLLDRAKKKKKRVIQTRKVFKDKSGDFEIEVMKGEFPILSKRDEAGYLFHSLNCYYQLRLHFKGRELPKFPQISFNNKKTPMFVSIVEDEAVTLFLDNRIQEYKFGDKIVEDVLSEYELTIPSEGAESSQFWFAPGLTVAPSFSFIEKDKVIRLGEGKKVSEKKHFEKLDKKLEELLTLYRNDAFFNAPEEYCEIIQTCFNVNNKSLRLIADKVRDMYKNDCQGVKTRKQLREQNEQIKINNKLLIKQSKQNKK